MLRHPPPTVFDRPQWKLLPDPAGPRNYANVNNLLEIATGRSRVHVPLAVPTELFTYLRDVAKVAPTDNVSLSMDKVEEWYVFSALVAEAKLIDLWAYPAKHLPDWMLKREYQS